jgi:hypothetical protein
MRSDTRSNLGFGASLNAAIFALSIPFRNAPHKTNEFLLLRCLA